MVRVFLTGKFGQSFFSTAAPLLKKSTPYLVQTVNLTTQAILITKLTKSFTNTDKVSAEEITSQDKPTNNSSRLNM